MKRVKVIVRANLVVGYWELIPMESWNELLDPHDTSTVRVSEERRSGKIKRTQWWSQANWPRLKEALVKSQDPYLRGQWDVDCLESGLDQVPKQTVLKDLQRIGRSRSHMRMSSLIRRGHFYQICR